MGNIVIFRTPGELPVEAFTMVGVNAKPNSTNPIGFFGTGLKYAIAVLLRTSQKVTIFIGRKEYVFETRSEDFRGKEIQTVVMRKREGVLSKWRTIKLPFTLEYGKTWEMWQAYRELHTNTLDEGGEAIDGNDMSFDSIDDVSMFADVDHSLVVVEGEEFKQAYYDRFKTFLPEGLRERNSTEGIQVFDKPSKHIYYRGMRVFDFPEKVESIYTYNFVSRVELTEDRTAKYPFLLEAAIGEMLVSSENREFIQGVIRAPAGSFEQKLNLNYVHRSPSSIFRTYASRSYARGHAAYSYIKAHTAAPKYTFSVRDIVQSYIDLCAAHGVDNQMVKEAKQRIKEDDDEIIF